MSHIPDEQKDGRRILIWIAVPQWADYGEPRSGWYTAEWCDDTVKEWRIGLPRIEACDEVSDAHVPDWLPLPDAPKGQSRSEKLIVDREGEDASRD